MTPEPCEDWVEAISAYADGEATSVERESVESHLAECAACAEWLAAIERDREVYTEAYAESERGAAYVGAVLEKLPAEQEEVKERRRGIRFSLVELLTSAVIVLIVGAVGTGIGMIVNVFKAIGSLVRS